MNRLARTILLVPAVSLGLALAGCETFDPTAILDLELFNTKKKLPGERQPVFPEGTPGISQGVPPEMVKGYQPPAEPPAKQAEPAAKQTEPAAKQAEPAEKPKPKPKPKVVAKPKDEPKDEPKPTTVTVRPAQPQPASQPQWPDPPRQQPAAGGGGWPGSAQSSGQVAWPDPPASR
jgi:outer membrane biosynthesis protein TonB